MANRIDNIDLIVACRDLIKAAKVSGSPLHHIHIYDQVHDVTKLHSPLPDEFIIVRTEGLDDTLAVNVSGTVEVCIYVRNLQMDDDLSQPNLHRLNELTKAVLPVIYDAQKNGTFFEDISENLVMDSEIGYYYNSLVITTTSINMRFYNS
jgi:hypothetical protein